MAPRHLRSTSLLRPPRATRYFETRVSPHFLMLLGARETPSNTKQCAHPNAYVVCGKACSVRRVPWSTLADEYPVQSERPFGFAGKQQNIYLGKSLTHLPVRVFIDAERISRRLCVDIQFPAVSRRCVSALNAPRLFSRVTMRFPS